uniref:Uncharacterized protein n=1 Tax=Anopheles atroparvus TaxID=41427 RepID=A0AAG5D8T5_ANOAO
MVVCGFRQHCGNNARTFYSSSEAPLLCSSTIGKHPYDTADASLCKHLLVPGQQVTAGTLGWNFEPTVDVLHQHVAQLRIVQRLDGGIDL